MLSVIVAIMQIICPFLQMSKTSKWLFWKISLQIFVHFLQHTYFSKNHPSRVEWRRPTGHHRGKNFLLKIFIAVFLHFEFNFLWIHTTHTLSCGKYGSVENSVILIWPRCAFLKKTQIDQNFWTKRYLLGCEMCGLDTGFK